MKSSNLAERLEEYEALEKLRLREAPVTRVVMERDEAAATARSSMRRTRRAAGIVIRDDGLRAFRVR